MQLCSQESRRSGQTLERHRLYDFQARSHTRHFLVPIRLAPERPSGRLAPKGGLPQPAQACETPCCTFWMNRNAGRRRSTDREADKLDAPTKRRLTKIAHAGPSRVPGTAPESKRKN